MPKSLFQQTALMIQFGILDMESIYKMLGPTDQEMKRMAAADLSEAKKAVRSMNVLSTSGKPEDMDVDQNGDDVSLNHCVYEYHLRITLSLLIGRQAHESKVWSA